MQKKRKTRIRRRNSSKNSHLANYCGFCRKNKLENCEYRTHKLRDKDRVMCPILRAFTCSICLAKGDQAHTLTYCPYVTKPWRLLKLTISHWASLPISVQYRLSDLARESGVELVEPIRPESFLDRLSSTSEYMDLTIEGVLKLVRSINYQNKMDDNVPSVIENQDLIHSRFQYIYSSNLVLSLLLLELT